ncbi:hypothetical protein CU098_007670, partial [Rhizopus stolonifer]
MSKRNLRSLEHLADEEQELYINIRRNRIKKQNESKNSHFDNLSQDIIFELEQLNKKQFKVKNVVFGKSSN